MLVMADFICNGWLIFRLVYPHLTPKEIYRGYEADNQAQFKGETRGGGTIKSVVIWQYSTLYTEVFMIEEINY